MPTKTNNTEKQNQSFNLEEIREGIMSSLFSIFALGKQLRMLRKMYRITKDPEITKIMKDMKMNNKLYKDKVQAIKKKYEKELKSK